MGATGWEYFTEWREDVEQAYEQLRARVFAAGEFQCTDGEPIYNGEDWLEGLGVARAPRPVRPPGWKPATIEEAVSHMGLDGTHSILDAFGVSESPEFGKVSPAPEGWLVEVYGSARPMRAEVEARRIPAQLIEDRMVYFAVWEEGRPRWWYFQGQSGD